MQSIEITRPAINNFNYLILLQTSLIIASDIN